MHNAPEHDIAPETRFDVINPLTSTDWDQFISQCADACVFHSSAWARLLTETYRFPLPYIVQRRGTRIVAGLALAETGGKLRPRRGVSLPFTDLCPPLQNSLVRSGQPIDPSTPAAPRPASRESAPPGQPEPRSLLDAAFAYAQRRRWKSLELREAPADPGLAESSVEFWGHSLDLTGGLNTVEARRSDSVSRSTRKAAKTGLRIRQSQHVNAMKEYFRLHCLTRQRHGQPPQPWAYFANLQRVVLEPGLGTILLAVHDEQAVAGVVLLHLGRHAVYKFGASDSSLQAVRPNNFVFAEMIKHCIQIGCTTLDFGRTSLSNEGLRRFKLGWGCEERRIRYQCLDVESRKVLPLHDRASSWHNRIFRLMPLPVAAVIGRLAYRFAA